jgi:hypothetical protein
MKHLLPFVVAILTASTGWTFPSDPPVSLKASVLTGKWMLNGMVKAVRFDLKQNGTFEYVGYGSESKGRWNVEGHQVRLRWTQVDAVPVDSQKVTGLYPLESGALRIGRFEYRKKPAPFNKEAASTPGF